MRAERPRRESIQQAITRNAPAYNAAEIEAAILAVLTGPDAKRGMRLSQKTWVSERAQDILRRLHQGVV